MSAILDRMRGAAVGLAVVRAVFAPERDASPETPADYGMEFEDWQWRTSRDRVPVAAWFVPGASPHAVLVSHGMGQSKAAVLRHALLLNSAGYAVLAVDNRNHGASGSSRRRWDLASRFTSDLGDAVERLRADARVTGSVAVLAFSFSCWPAVRAARREGAAIDAVICDSGPVLDMGAAVSRLARLRSATMPDWVRSGPGQDAMAATARKGFGLALAERRWPPLEEGPPVLCVAGARDRVLPAHEVEEFAARVPGVRVRVVPRAGHLKGLTVEPEAYAATVLDFLGATTKVPARSGDVADG